jgi:flavin reductase (DIM6/NTAB) family NADH-FMN oxidoreductase RutF
VPPFDSLRFRQVLGHFPTGVTVVTGLVHGDDGDARRVPKPTGVTIGSFTSVSLDPPLVGFLPAFTSDSWRDIRPSAAFCVNVLADDQVDYCWRFAKEADDRFDGIRWEPAPVTGSPILPGVVAWIDCTVERELDAGDHWLVVGRVEALDHADPWPNPMVFFRGQVGGYSSPVA